MTVPPALESAGHRPRPAAGSVTMVKCPVEALLHGFLFSGGQRVKRCTGFSAKRPERRSTRAALPALLLITVI